MILNITVNEFSALDARGKKRIFSEFLGHKVNEIMAGGMTNCKWGKYVIRHETCAYSQIKIDPTPENKTHITIYNYSTKQWEENDHDN